MKGGNYLVLEALRQLARAGVGTQLPVTVLFTSDEEVGSPSTRDLIEAEAARHRVVLVPEPGHAAGAAAWSPAATPSRASTCGHRPAQPRRRPPGRGPLGHPGDGAPDRRDRGHDRRRLHLQRRRRPRRPMGELRRHHLHRRGAEHGQAAGRPGPRRGARCWRCGRRATAWRSPSTRGVTRPVWEPDAGPWPCSSTPPAWPTAWASSCRTERRRRLGRQLHRRHGRRRRWTGWACRARRAHTLEEHIEVDSLVDRGRLLAGLLATLD